MLGLRNQCLSHTSEQILITSARYVIVKSIKYTTSSCHLILNTASGATFAVTSALPALHATEIKDFLYDAADLDLA